MPTPEWKFKRFGEKWQRGETLNYAIGQGYTLTTPLQATRFVAALVNGGKILRPTLLLSEEPEVLGELPISPAVRKLVVDAMVATVEEDRGTARILRRPGLRIGGKTGTAQVVKLQDKHEKRKPTRFRINTGITRGWPVSGKRTASATWSCPWSSMGARQFRCGACGRRGAGFASWRSNSGPAGRVMFDRRLVFHINWGLLTLTAILFLVGVMNLYSASTLRLASGVELDTYFNKQLLWGGVGLCVMTAIVLVDYRHLKSVSWPFFILCLLLLVGVSVAGKTIYGAKRWLDLGFFNLQPTELTKIAVLILGSRLMARMDGRLGWVNLGKILLIGLIPAAFVVKQPDLGSALNILLILGGMILFKGITSSVFKVLAVAIPVMLPFGWFFCAIIRSSAS